jgi:hypothetical protein
VNRDNDLHHQAPPIYISEVNDEVETTDQQTEQSTILPEKPKRNRLVFFGIFTALILFVGIFLILFLRNGFLPTSLDNSMTKYSQYKTQRFSIVYPADWTLKEGEFYGGSGISVSPKGGLGHPLVYVVEYNNLENLELTERLNSEYNYKRSTIKLTEGEATVWSGSRKATMSGWQIQERMILLVRPDRYYNLILMYPSEKLNRQYEKIFSEIISTFKLQE